MLDDDRTDMSFMGTGSRATEWDEWGAVLVWLIACIENIDRRSKDVWCDFKTDLYFIGPLLE